MKLVRSITEQEELGVKNATQEYPYIGILVNKESERTWYVAERFGNQKDAVAWWEAQRPPARIIRVLKGIGILHFAK